MLPVLQHEWGRRNIGKAIYGEIAQEKLPPVDVVPDALCCCRDEILLFASWVVVAKDEEDVWVVYA